MGSFTEIATLELTRLLTPLERLRTPAGVADFVRQLGWDFESALDAQLDLSGLVELVDALIETIGDWAEAETDEQATAALEGLAAQIPPIVVKLKDDIPAIEAALGNLPDLVGETDEIAATLARRFPDWLLYTYLERHRPRLFAVLHVLGLADIVVDGHGMPVRTMHWDRIEPLFTDPLRLADEVYDWNTPAGFDADEFLVRVERFMQAFLLPGGVYRQNATIHAALGRPEDEDRELRIPLFQGGRWPTDYREFDVNLTPLPASNSDKAGLALYPFVYGALDLEQALGSGWTLRIRGSADIALGFGVSLRPPHSLTAKANLFSENALSATEARLEVTAASTASNDELVYVFGSDGASHLGYREVALGALVALAGGKEEFGVEFEVLGLTLAISADGADTFLQELLSAVEIKTTCDLVLGYSNVDGVYFRGSGGLEVVIPIHESLGPIELESVLVGVTIDNGFHITLAASFSAEIGPVSAAVQEIGLRIPISFPPEQDGNLGPVQIEAPKFKPPTGAGLSLDAGGLIGGGFLDFDEANERYAGILALMFGEIGIVAIGLITTRMPDGSQGFSMLVNIGVTFDPPIQLSMGFTLSGVGGLIGVNRSMEIDVLREGVRKRTLDSILFPDPAEVIPNAAKIISDLRSVFPPEEGRFVVGPMVKIGYGSPNIIVADIGIFLELFDPFRIVLLGQLAMDLPEKKDPIVRINLDIVGVLDFEKKELSFQASLYDSGVLSFELFGDAAFFLSWGARPEFAMSLGGFHPKFTPPPPPIVFDGLRRLGLSLSKGSDFRLTCGCYQALTPNSLQFGARVDLYAAAMGAVVTGYLGFDTLIYFSPFSFEIALGAALNISYQGASLADIRVTLTLSGPTPWDARGVAVIKVLFFDIGVRFRFKWGRDDAARLDPVDPWPALRAALTRAESWGSRLPAAASMVEALREIRDEPAEVAPGEEPAAAPVVVHPAGSLEVRENVAPLGMRLRKFGNAPVASHDTFRVDRVTTADGHELEHESVDEFFARGQFEGLTSTQRLSVPSFERLPGGVTTASSNRIRLEGQAQREKLRYESIVIKSDRTAEAAGDAEAATSSWAAARFLLAGGAARRSALRSAGKARFAHHDAGMVGTMEEKYLVVNRDTLQPVELDEALGIANGGMPRTIADQAQAAHSAWHPEVAEHVTVVAEHEAEAVT